MPLLKQYPYCLLQEQPCSHPELPAELPVSFVTGPHDVPSHGPAKALVSWFLVVLGAMAWSRPLSAHIWSSRAGGGRRAQLVFQHSPGLSVLGVEVEAGLAPCLPHPGECLK